MNRPLLIRCARGEDEPAVLEIIERTGFFRPVEVDIAREVFSDSAEMKPGCTYQSYVAEADEAVAGWICFGATPCTLGTFDLYWLAVDPSFQRRGIGRDLVCYAEEEIRRQHGRLVVVETSGIQRYAPTRAFYERLGYVLAARIPEFYAPGDDKCVYLKPVS